MKGVDPGVYALAELFLEDHLFDTDNNTYVDELALRIQQAIEDFVAEKNEVKS